MGAQLSSADSHFVDLLLDFESPIPLPKHATINAGLLHAQRPNGSATGVGSGGGVMSGGIGTLLGLGGLFGSRGGGGGAAAVSSHQAAAAASESSCIPLYYQCDGPIPPHISKRIMGRTSHMYVSQNKNKEAREEDERKEGTANTSKVDARVLQLAAGERAQIENNQHMATTKNEKVECDASSTSSLSSVFVKAQKLRAERIQDLLHFTSVLLDQCTCNGSVSSSAPVPAALALTRVVVKSIIEETAARVQKIRTRNARKESQRLLRIRKRGGAEESNLSGSNTVVGQQQKAAELEVFMAGDNAVVSGGSAENDIMMPKRKKASRPQLTNIRLALQEAFWLRDQYLLKDAPRRFQEKRNQKDCYQQHQQTSSAAAVELASPVVPKLIANICDFIIRCPITPSTALTHVESLKLLLLFCSCGLYDSFEGASVLKHTLAATTTSSATAAFGSKRNTKAHQSVAEADAANSTGAADDEKKKKKQRDLNSVTASGLTVSDEEDDDGLAAALKRHRRLLRVPNRNEDINSKKTSKRRRHPGGVAPRSDRELTLSSTSGSDQDDDDFNENRNNRGYFSSSSPQSSSSSSAAAFYSDDEDPTEKSYNFKKNTTTTRGSLSASRTSPSLSAADLFVDILLGSETAAGLVLELIRRAALFKVIVSNGGVSNANTSVGVSGLTSSVQTAMSVGVGGGLDLALLGLQPLSSDDDAVRKKVCHQLAASLPHATTVTTNITSGSRGVFSSSVRDESAASPSHDATTSEDQKQSQSQSSKVPLLALVASSYNMYGSTVAAMAAAPRGCGGGENGHFDTNPLAVVNEDQSGHGNQGAVEATAPDIHSSVSASKEDSTFIGREVDRHSSIDGGAVARHSLLGAVPQHTLPRRTSNDALSASPHQSMPCEGSTEDGGRGVGWFGGWFRGGGGGLSNSNKKRAEEMRKDEFVSPLPKDKPQRDGHQPPQQVRSSSNPINGGDDGVVNSSRRKEEDEGIKGNGLLQPKDEERDAGNDENGMQDTSGSSSSSSSSSGSDVSSDEEEEDCVLHQYASAGGNNGAAVPSSASFGSVKAYSARSVLYELSLQLLCVLLFHRRGFEASSSVSENNNNKNGNWFAAGSDGDDLRDDRGRQRSPLLSASAAVTPNAAAASAATNAAHVAHTDYLDNRENKFFSNTARDIVKSLVNTKAPTTSSSSAPSTTSAALPSSVNFGTGDPNADPSGIHYLQLMHSANPLAISFAQLAASLSAASTEHPLALAVLYSLLVDNKNFLKIMLTKYSDISETMVIAILQSLVASSDCVAERPVVATVESEDTSLNESGNANGEEHQQVKQTDKGSSSGKEAAVGGWLSWLGGGAGSRQQQKPDTSKNSGAARSSSSSVTPSVTNSEERYIIVRNDRDAHAQQALLIPAATASNMPRYAYHDHRHHNNNNNNQKRIVALLGSAAGGAGDGSTAVESYNSATAQSLCYAFHLASTLVMVLSQDMCVANALFGPWKLAGQKINSTTSSRKAWSWLTHGTISSCGTLWISAICRCLLRGFTLHYYEATSLLIAALQNVGPFMHNLDTVAAQRLTRVLSGSIRRLPREASEVYRLERLVVMMRRRRAARRQQMLDLLVGSSNSNGTPKNFGDDGNKFSSTDEGNEVWAAAVRLLRLRREERRVASAYLDRRILLKTLVGTIIGLSDCVGGAISVTDKQNYSLFYELLYHKPQLELEGEAAGVPPAEEDTNNNTAANIQSATAKRRQIAAAGIAYLKRFRPHLLLLSAAAEEHEGFSSSSLSSASFRRRSRKRKMNACTSQALALLHCNVQNYSSDILLLEGADLDAAVPPPPPLSSLLQNSTADYALSPTTAVGSADPQLRTPRNVSHHQHGGGTVRGGDKSSPAELMDSGFVYIPSVHSPMTAACAGAANDSAFVLVAEALRPVRSIAAMVDTELASVSVNHTPEGILALIRSVVASHAALLEKQRQHQQELHQQSHGSHPHRNMSSSNTTTATNTGSFNKSPTYVGVGDTQSQISSSAGSSALTTMASNCLDLVFVYRESPASAEFFMPMVWATIVSSGRVGSGHWHADPASLPLLEKTKTIIVSRGANLTNV